MTKITLDRETFKALASDTRLDILRTLDGKHLGLNDMVDTLNLTKATMHEHLTKLQEAGLIKKTEREGHKWVYYRLTWKGQCLLHPENSRIVVLFTTTLLALSVGIVQLVWYIRGTIADRTYGYDAGPLKDVEGTPPILNQPSEPLQAVTQNPLFLYIAIGCFVLFTVLLCITVWRFQKNKTPKM